MLTLARPNANRAHSGSRSNLGVCMSRNADQVCSVISAAARRLTSSARRSMSVSSAGTSPSSARSARRGRPLEAVPFPTGRGPAFRNLDDVIPTGPIAKPRRRRRAVTPLRPRPLALLYVLVSTAEQVDDGASLAAQQATLESFARAHDWDTRLVTDAGVSGKSLDRPGMNSALARLTEREADILAAVRLDRISRSVYDVAGLMQRSVEQGWGLVTVQGSIDTSSAMGRAYVHMAALFAELERGMSGERTKAGMAQRRAEGVHLGRRTALPIPVIERIRSERGAGRSYHAIARDLTDDGIPTATHNTVWQVSSVQSALSVKPNPAPVKATAP